MPDVTPQATPGQAPPWECPNHPGTWVITGACIACIDRYSEMVNVATRIAAERDRLAAENASLREQLLRTEEQCRRHVNQAGAQAARCKAERDEALQFARALTAENGRYGKALQDILTIAARPAVIAIVRAALAGDAPRWQHSGCGGTVTWDTGGGHCAACHAEGLAPLAAEPGSAA